jgi:hypothetical protein
MTTQEKIAVMQADVDGKQIQYYNDNTWMDISNGEAIWTWDLCDYRIKPEPKRVPLTADDIPPVCWICSPSCGWSYLVHAVVNDGVHIPGQSTVITWDALKDLFNYSTDRKTWKPCYKEVEE